MTKRSSNSASRTLIITPGEPAGVGPDLILALAREERSTCWVVAADIEMLRERAQLLGYALTLDEHLERPSTEASRLTVAHIPLARPAIAGRLQPENAASVVRTLEYAHDGCLDGRFDALVTGPVQKSVINEGGVPFTGHTEFLQERSSVEDVVMMLAADALRVALVTTHLPLREVPDAISPALLERRLRILHEALLSSFGIRNPRILLCGLNPHAGEKGHLGREEIEVFEPVAEKLRGEGWRLVGPMPADTAFTPAQLDGADAVMAAFHDQGLPVLKHAGFGRAVNITLGLPFVRTSVDHGTALDLAGSGAADAGSFAAAIDCAATLCR